MRQRGKFGEEPQVEVKVDPVRKQTLTEWITDICKVKECRDGFVSKEVKGYDTLFACPACDRYKRDLYPYQSIPTAKKWAGTVELYTEAEMRERMRDRQERVEQPRARTARAPELNIDSVGGPF